MQITKKKCLIALMFLALILFITNAWMGDDGFIIMKSVDNLVNGYGARFNIADRVQSFTSPLWFMLITPFYFVTREPYFTLLALSVVISFGTLYLIGWKLPKVAKVSSKSWFPVLALFALLSSKVFVDYSVSGLENPLECLLIALLVLKFINHLSLTTKRYNSLFIMAILCSLIIITRHDLLLVCFPLMAYAWWMEEEKAKAFVPVALGGIPFFVWEIVSIIYYGFPFPNTAYAKLSTGIESSRLMAQGLNYVKDLMGNDPLTMIVIIFSFVSTIKYKSKQSALILSGALLYIFYIIKVGGDFMSGRFFMVPLLLSVMALAFIKNLFMSKRSVTIMITAILFFGVANPSSPYLFHFNEKDQETNGDFFKVRGIIDEKAFYFDGNGLVHIFKGEKVPSYAWIKDGKKYRNMSMILINNSAVGMFGYYNNPTNHIVDNYALVDPLLARIPLPETQPFWLPKNGGWRIGHYYRPLPRGYIESLSSKENKIEHKQIAKLYEKIKLVTTGPLFSKERFIAIWELNTGYADKILDFEGYTDVVAMEELSDKNKSGAPYDFLLEWYWWHYASSVVIDFGFETHALAIDISLDPDNQYLLEYLSGGNVLESETLKDLPVDENIEGLMFYRYDVPVSVAENGYDQVRVTKTAGDDGYYLGYFNVAQD